MKLFVVSQGSRRGLRHTMGHCWEFWRWFVEEIKPW